jgi:phi LC3 family holin
MKINWQVRGKNIYFWIGLFSAVCSPVLAALGMNFSDFTTWDSVIEALKNFISNPYLVGSAIFAILSFLGIVTDPTTKGINDSERAMTYTEPK